MKRHEYFGGYFRIHPKKVGHHRERGIYLVFDVYCYLCKKKSPCSIASLKKCTRLVVECWDCHNEEKFPILDLLYIRLFGMETAAGMVTKQSFDLDALFERNIEGYKRLYHP